MHNVTRWFRFIDENNSWIAPVIQSMNTNALETKMAKSKEGGSYDIVLPEIENGVVTRFPPEPSYVINREGK